MTSSGPRILMTTDAVGGVLGYSLDLCRAIVQAGGEVLLVRLGPKGSGELERVAAELPRVQLVCADHALEWMEGGPEGVLRSAQLLLSLERDFAPDVVHLNGYALGALPFRAPVLVVAHSCVLSWWQAVQGGAAPASYATYRALVVAGLHGADLVVAPSEFMLRALRDHYAAAFPALVLHNAANAIEHAPAAARTGACCAGRWWDSAKNLDLLLRAAPGSGWEFRVAGETRAPDGTSAVLPGEAPPNVQLLGTLPRAELAAIMAESALYVHPARYEPFGLSVLEAAHAGCALVLADVPSLRELWDGAAVFFQPDDAAELRAALLRLREDPRRRLSLARRAHQHARRYGMSQFVRRYLTLYLALAQRGRRARTVSNLHAEARTAAHLTRGTA